MIYYSRNKRNFFPDGLEFLTGTRFETKKSEQNGKGRTFTGYTEIASDENRGRKQQELWVSGGRKEGRRWFGDVRRFWWSLDEW